VLKEIGPGLTAGFVVAGRTAATVLIRAVGPTLAAFGVEHPLSDPRLELMAAGGGVLAANDDWGGGPSLVEAFTRTGAFAVPADTKDAALVAPLPSGGYTVRVSGPAGMTGMVLVEVYALP
jgi:hypothetical protein